MVQPDITFYTHGTPNGHKISIALELLEIPYKLVELSWEELAARLDWFVKINPNSKIPAIVDHSNGDFPVFESGAILLYIAQNYDPEHKLWPKNSKLQQEVIQWVMYQISGIGPYQGQGHHFVYAAPEKIPYAINRYVNETKRIFSVLNERLEGRQYLVADQLTIADVAFYSQVGWGYNLGIDFDDYSNLKAWLQQLDQHPKFVKGMNIPEPTHYVSTRNDPIKLREAIQDARQTLYGASSDQ